VSRSVAEAITTTTRLAVCRLTFGKRIKTPHHCLN